MPITKKRTVSIDAAPKPLVPQAPPPAQSLDSELTSTMQDLVTLLAMREKPKAPKSLTAKIESRVTMSDGTQRISEVSILDSGNKVMAIKVTKRDNAARIQDIQITNLL